MIKYEVVAQNGQVLIRNILSRQEALIVVHNLELSHKDDKFMIRVQKH